MPLLELQDAVTAFFRNATPQVFLDGYASVVDPNTGADRPPDFPYITFSYSTSDYFQNTLLTFQIWTQSANWIEALAIEGRIAEALPALGGATLDIPGETIYEYRSPGTGAWTMFRLEDIQRIAQEVWDRYGQPLKYRETHGKPKGTLWLTRGNPFGTPRTTDEPALKLRYGTIAVRSYLI